MTGSGKTYTMLGPRLMESAFEGQRAPTAAQLASCDQRGLMVRVAQHLFQQLPEAQVTMSYVQIYQERCFDLLQAASVAKPLRVREDQRRSGPAGVLVEGLTEAPVANVEDCLQYLITGFANVAFRSTNFNEQSSRAHCVLTLTLSQRLVVDQRPILRTSKIRLVDLAGNERWVTDGQISRQHARELATINRSLHILGCCMQILSNSGSKHDTNRHDFRETARHVPYRDSLLTLFLRDSLAGNSCMLMVCTICCSMLYQMQTLCTLRFADRVKRVKMKAVVCDTLDTKEVQSQMQAEVEYLRAVVTGGSAGDQEELKRRVAQLQKALSGLQGENRALREQIVELETTREKPPKAARARLRRANSEPSFPSAADEEPMLEAAYRSHDDMGSGGRAGSGGRGGRGGRGGSGGGGSGGGGSSGSGGCCPQGHELKALGSIADPLPVQAAYLEWHCDNPGCRGSSRMLNLGRFHCDLCQHDLCQYCYEELMGRSRAHASTMPRVHEKAKARPAPRAPAPVQPLRPDRPDRPDRSDRPDRPDRAPANVARVYGTRRAASEKPKTEDTAKAASRVRARASPRKTPRATAAESPIASLGSASTATTTPERRLPQVPRTIPVKANPNLPPVRKEEEIPQTRIFLPAEDAAPRGPKRSPHDASPSSLAVRGPAAPAPAPARRPNPAALAAANARLVPDAIDMRALLGELDAKHAGA
ncbi:unnamed protein product [Effrenium voratum]|nr:unnamed protein product [Effrenium voratum]